MSSAEAAEAGPAAPELDDEGSRFEAPALLKIVWVDPEHMPEHIALWALKYFGPRAPGAVAKLRAAHPEADFEELARLIIQRGTRRAMAEGAFLGGPFLVLVPIAFVAALLSQSQMVLELAELAGRKAADQTRAADLLVLTGVYPSTAEASKALAGVKREATGRKRVPKGARINMIMRMAYLLGVLGVSQKTSRLVQYLRWGLVTAVFLVGLALPLVWVPYLAYSYRKSTLWLGERATEYYSHEAEESGVAVVRAGSVRIGGAVAALRTIAIIVIPVIGGIVALLTGLKLAGGSLVTGVIVLIALSVLAALGWYGLRWWRRRHARPAG